MSLAITLAIKAWQEEELARTRTWSLAGAGLWTYRLLPPFAPGVELSVRRALGEHVLVRVGVVSVAAFDATLAQHAGTFDAVLLGGRTDGCARAQLASGVSGGACLGLLSGMLYAAGADVANPTRSVVPWVAASGAADVEFELSERWSLALGLSTTFLLHQVEVGLEDERGMPAERRALARFAFAMGLGPVYYF